ncbi:MAG: hypothetical protein ABH826_04420 [Patescibacteria group bacterium]|nr:hypothetical protein [Patescibacteria group bacterium]
MKKLFIRFGIIIWIIFAIFSPVVALVEYFHPKFENGTAASIEVLIWAVYVYFLVFFLNNSERLESLYERGDLPKK